MSSRPVTSFQYTLYAPRRVALDIRKQPRPRKMCAHTRLRAPTLTNAPVDARWNNAASKMSSQLYGRIMKLRRLADSFPPLCSLGIAILCNISTLPHTQAEKRGERRKCFGAAPIVSSLATINCQNVPHNSVRARARSLARAKPPYIFKANALNWFLPGQGNWALGVRTPRWIIRNTHGTLRPMRHRDAARCCSKGTRAARWTRVIANE